MTIMACHTQTFKSACNKYAKNLYRLLKQYQATGKYIVKYNQFKELMDIPNKYETCDIDKRILKPSIIKLTETSPFGYMFFITKP